MKPAFLTISLLSATIIAARSLAAPADAPADEARRQELLKKHDKNGDGKLDDAERAAAEKAREQFQGQRPPGPRGARFREEMIKRFDKDGDGVLNDEERAAAQAAGEELRQRRRERDPAAPKPPGGE